jgi:hypothetical protein
MKSSLPANYTLIIKAMEFQLAPRHTDGANARPTTDGWHLEIPAGDPHGYRLAQLDDYEGLPRARFGHAAPWTLKLRARVSQSDLPGTWGFGLWNDPMGFSIGFGKDPSQLPALPQAVWFMHASPPNWLSFLDAPRPEDAHPIPANGFFAGTFRSPEIPSWLFTPGLLALPLFEFRPTSRLLRRQAAKMILQDGAPIPLDVTQWHEYAIAWLDEGCFFTVDSREILVSKLAPHPPLGLVIWIDNQFAAWTPEGRLGYGTLETPAAWMEIEKLVVQQE